MFDYKQVLLYLFLSSEYASDEDEHDAFMVMLPYMKIDGSIDYEKLHRESVPFNMEGYDAIS